MKGKNQGTENQVETVVSTENQVAAPVAETIAESKKTRTIKTFVVSKNQIAVLRARAIENGVPAEEIDALKGSDLALRFKVVNDIEGVKISAEKTAAFKTKFASFIGFDLASHKDAPTPVVALAAETAPAEEITA